MYEIIDKKVLNSAVELMVVRAPFVARRCEPGQFIILRVDEEGERVPFTIADFNREDETVTIIYQIVGHTTEVLSSMKVGDKLCDFVGPLGKASELKKEERVLGIAGGLGAAPLYPQIRKLREMGVECDIIIGSRSEEFIILEESFRGLGCNISIATDDGSKGVKGFVTDILKDKINQGIKYDSVIAIGPLIMMKAVVDITKPLNIPTTVSLNPIMVDGTGMCGGCRVSVGDETKFACVDGPEFNGLLVDFDEVINRQGIYKKEEEHMCKIGLGGK
ncbi:MAG: sulfide/dihydroorotate dehydrogenase-like FAD/NAD-binding protein [Epulopiscium sp.]|nr:sulfide/dihydroorotate dehydrogenase-like FAD/NAD-binding protein [Candidatus Epulonipiscium sp.]